MSPSLFLFCMEYLSRILKEKAKYPYFKYHPKCRANCITHIGFADDLMLYSRGDIASIGVLMECLNKLEECSWLMVSSANSNIFLAGVKGIVRDKILEGIGFEEGKFPVRYLGIPLSPMKVSVAEFSPFLEVLKLFGCISFLCLQPSLRRLPPFVLHSYGGGEGGGGMMSRVGWKDICCPKEEGGLGLKHIKTWNMALLTVWNIHTNAETLWVKSVHSIYLRGQSIWEYVSGDRDSYLMKRLIIIRDAVVRAYRSRKRAISGLSKMVIGRRFASGKVYDLLRRGVRRSHG
ncbi:hypothetical protein LIER_32427 [Lithospermum erythrorhizon]|uniref:Reverse transcriptase domain-containing protein n=1 Tax=Lithospermum erythrorhizon TaxID=34254 RepID=A0AAV3RUR8_LITER